MGNGHSNERAEALLRDMRGKLAIAHTCEVAGAIELADAFGAVAANKLAQAVSLAEPQRKAA